MESSSDLGLSSGFLSEQKEKFALVNIRVVEATRGWLPVSPSPTRLLVVGLDGLWQRPVGDKPELTAEVTHSRTHTQTRQVNAPDIRLVYPHAKADGCHDDGDSSGHPLCLHSGPLI